ncbi:MAG: hypothetical protein ABFS45_17970 [Pseudomonadota bacterium]
MTTQTPKWPILLLLVCLPLQAMATPYLQGYCDMAIGAELSSEDMDSSGHDCCQDDFSAPLLVCEQCVVCALTVGSAVASGSEVLPFLVLKDASPSVGSSSMHSRFNDTLYKPPRTL